MSCARPGGAAPGSGSRPVKPSAVSGDFTSRPPAHCSATSGSARTAWRICSTSCNTDSLTACLASAARARAVRASSPITTCWSCDSFRNCAASSVRCAARSASPSWMRLCASSGRRHARTPRVGPAAQNQSGRRHPDTATSDAATGRRVVRRWPVLACRSADCRGVRLGVAGLGHGRTADLRARGAARRQQRNRLRPRETDSGAERGAATSINEDGGPQPADGSMGWG